MSGSSNSDFADAGRRLALGALLAAAAGLSWPVRARAQSGGAPGCDAASALPARFRLDYVAQARRGALSLDGENELVFIVEGTRYTLRSATRSLLFSAEQESSGELRGALLLPHDYRERSMRRAARTTHIDWRGDRVTFSQNADGATTTQPLLQDRLSLLLQVGQQLRAQQGRGAVALPVAGTRHVTTYRFELRGAETLDLPAGRFETHRLERPLNAEHDGLEMWIAPSLCWLPVRLRFTDDRGQLIENELRAARFD
jgi:hypothetical protein